MLFLQLLAMLVTLAGPSLVVAVSSHPTEAAGRWAWVLRLLGRLSVLRYDDGPGTLHYPGTTQPLPPRDLGVEALAQLLHSSQPGLFHGWDLTSEGEREARRTQASFLLARYHVQPRQRYAAPPAAPLPGGPYRSPAPVKPDPSTPPPTPVPGSGRLVLLLLPLLGGAVLLLGCATLGSALKTCAVQAVPATVVTGVNLALHQAEGWEKALADLVKDFGACVVRTEVELQARPQAVGTTAAALVGASILSGVAAVDDAEAQRRARAWLVTAPR